MVGLEKIKIPPPVPGVEPFLVYQPATHLVAPQISLLTVRHGVKASYLVCLTYPEYVQIQLACLLSRTSQETPTGSLRIIAIMYSRHSC